MNETAFFGEIEPLVRRIVHWRLGMRAPAQELEDVTSDVLLDLLTRLDSIARGESEEIADLAGYAAITSHHGCDRYLRRRFPRRHRLGLRVRYLLENSRQYALWQGRDGLVCGLATWKERTARTDLPPGWASEVAAPRGLDEAKAAAAVFEYAGAPLRLPDLVEALAFLLNVKDESVSIDEHHLEVPARAAAIDDMLSQRQTLARLWNEVMQLPVSQRTALLLNLRDEAGGCALTSLPATGVASIRQIASVLEMPPETLAGLWNGLPLNDLQIAEMLGITRQQVINLRKAARERLARRMAEK